MLQMGIGDGEVRRVHRSRNLVAVATVADEGIEEAGSLSRLVMQIWSA